jgi:glucose/arabinose dehydrogenase
MTNFATGWDDGTVAHGRPAAVTFSSDGRLFVANDVNGIIFWIAPMSLSPPGSDE